MGVDDPPLGAGLSRRHRLRQPSAPDLNGTHGDRSGRRQRPARRNPAARWPDLARAARTGAHRAEGHRSTAWASSWSSWASSPSSRSPRSSPGSTACRRWICRASRSTPRSSSWSPPTWPTKGLVLPLKREGRTLTVAMADPSDLGLLEDLKFITRFDLFPVIAGEFTLRSADREALRRRNDQQELAEPPQGHGGRGRGRRGRRGAGGRGRHPGADRRRAGRQADQRAPDRRGEAGRQSTSTSSRSSTRSGCATASTARCWRS